VHRSFEHSIVIPNTTPKALSSFLANIHNQTKFHPLIISVTEESPNHYVIVDQLSMFGIKFKLTYKAVVVSASPDQVVTEAIQPLVYLRNTTNLSAVGGGTQVHELVEIEAGRLFMGYTYSQIKSSHQELLNKLRDYYFSLPL
jgi:hypothetical protein